MLQLILKTCHGFSTSLLELSSKNQIREIENFISIVSVQHTYVYTNKRNAILYSKVKSNVLFHFLTQSAYLPCNALPEKYQREQVCRCTGNALEGT